MYLNQTKALTTLQELSEKLAISRNNLIKVSNQLTKRGLIDATRGKAGGVRIREGSGRVNLRAIVGYTEESFNLAGCFSDQKSDCTFLKGCRLKSSLNKALLAFWAALESTTLDDITPGASAG
jgi:Rrf2 family nitric oxide-sensitive transcriptional repressor